jgi:hypothetical protein
MKNCLWMLILLKPDETNMFANGEAKIASMEFHPTCLIQIIYG